MVLPITSSDTSPEWGRCLAACIGTLGAGLLLVFALMLLVDPYDSGRFGLLGTIGVDDRNTMTATASRARDVNFDSAIIGNSTAQMLEPAELSKATGLRFVQLYVTGANPHEQFAVLDFFLRHHARVGALVFVVDPWWCAHHPIESPPGAFPHWLYGDSSIAYAARLLSWPAIEHAFQRLSIGLGRHQRMDPTGFFSYEVAVVVVVPPTLSTKVAQPGTAEAAEREACNSALRRVVAGRPHSNFINYRIDNALTRDDANFADFIHYRPILASRMSEGIAASIKLGNAAKIDF